MHNTVLISSTQVQLILLFGIKRFQSYMHLFILHHEWGKLMEVTAIRNSKNSLWEGVKNIPWEKIKKTQQDVCWPLWPTVTQMLSTPGWVGSSDWSVYCKEHCGNWSRRLPKGKKAVLSVYTQMQAFRVLPGDARWRDGSEDRRKWSVTRELFFKALDLFIHQMGVQTTHFTQNKHLKTAA